MAILMRAVGLAALVALGAACRTGPEQWGPFRGQVVDVETGRPIAGAHVAVVWIREPPSLHVAQWFYDAQETVTDAEGRFEIPRETRLLTAWVRGPDVYVFAPAYAIQAIAVTPSDGREYVDATVVRMRPLKTRDEQCRHEPLGLTGDAQAVIPEYTRTERDYKVALQCGQLN